MSSRPFTIGEKIKRTKEGEVGEVIGFTRNGLVKCSFGTNRVIVFESTKLLKVNDKELMKHQALPFSSPNQNKIQRSVDRFELSSSSPPSSISTHESLDLCYIPIYVTSNKPPNINQQQNSTSSKKNKQRPRPKSLESVFDVQQHYHFQPPPPPPSPSTSSLFFGDDIKDNEKASCMNNNNDKHSNHCNCSSRLNGLGRNGSGHFILTGKSPRHRKRKEIKKPQKNEEVSDDDDDGGGGGGSMKNGDIRKDRRIRSLDSVRLSPQTYRKIHHQYLSSDHQNTTNSSLSFDILKPNHSHSSSSSLMLSGRSFDQNDKQYQNGRSLKDELVFQQNYAAEDIELEILQPEIIDSDSDLDSNSRSDEIMINKEEEGGEYRGHEIGGNRTNHTPSPNHIETTEEEEEDGTYVYGEDGETEWWETTNQLYNEELGERRVRIGVDLGSLLGMHLGEQTLRVYSVLQNSQAESAGISYGWRLVKVGNQKVSCLENFKAVVSRLKNDAENEYKEIQQSNLQQHQHQDASGDVYGDVYGDGHSVGESSSSVYTDDTSISSDGNSSLLIVEMLEFIVSVNHVDLDQNFTSSDSSSESTTDDESIENDKSYDSDNNNDDDRYGDNDDDGNQGVGINPILRSHSNVSSLNMNDPTEHNQNHNQNHNQIDCEDGYTVIESSMGMLEIKYSSPQPTTTSSSQYYQNSCSIESEFENDSEEEEDESEIEEDEDKEGLNSRSHRCSIDGLDCSICLELLSNEVSSKLPCGHYFHRECIAGLRSFGVNMVCPLCRSNLPLGPNQLFDEASWRYFILKRRVSRNETSFNSLKPDESRVMLQIFKYWQEASLQDHPAAQYNLGCLYERGRFVNKDVEKSISLYRKAAIQGFAQAQFSLGFLYEQGCGVDKSDTIAAKWYRKAAKQHDAKAQCNLGVLYDQGRGVKQSDFEALHLYWSAANQNIPDAQFNLGNMYSKGRGVPQSDRNAFKWFKKAALLNHVAAQYNLAVMIESHRGLHLQNDDIIDDDYNNNNNHDDHDVNDEEDDDNDNDNEENDVKQKKDASSSLRVQDSTCEAFHWYEKAAIGKHSLAQNNLGLCYEYGRGCDINEMKAFQWYSESSKQGNARGQYNLGYMYEKGRGCKQSNKEALIWYSKAARQGEEHAQAALGALLEKSR